MIQESVSKDDASGDRCTVIAKVFSETERHGGMIRFESQRPQLLVSVLAFQENICLPLVVGYISNARGCQGLDLLQTKVC